MNFFHRHSPSSYQFSSLNVSSAIATGPDHIALFDSQESNDPISTFNDRILKEQYSRRASERPNTKMDSGSGANVSNKEVDKYIKMRICVKPMEMIASMKTSVDVRTLSTTPISRTLYLVLTAFHDCSTIFQLPEEVPSEDDEVSVVWRTSNNGCADVVDDDNGSSRCALHSKMDQSTIVFPVFPVIVM
ncbi:hypothetical protein L2E82_31101 [Cichorium intybus]|uniref:Uncharacterized protein n=1 Tax=Cichorium intybus TaxID=13427 RepID=A0ACB9D2D0_CICIN|nr:hypothetical protein L2E82_31101 [Cichorium intybus]